MASKTLYDALFYADGPGFVEVQSLQYVGKSKVSLVRSSNGRCLCIRKETEVTELEEMANDDNNEITVAKHLRNVPGAVELRGWARYEDTSMSSDSTHVTYWRWYNSGTVHDLINHLQSYGISVPEPILWDILQTMFCTVRDFHQFNIAHNNVTDRNWLIDLKDAPNAMPEFGLAGFGSAEFKPFPLTKAWRELCRNDYSMVLAIVRMLALTATHSRDLTKDQKRQRQISYSSKFHNAMTFIEQMSTSDAPLTEAEWQGKINRISDFLDVNQPGTNARRQAYQDIEIHTLRRSPDSLPLCRPLEKVVLDFIETPSRTPAKFWLGTMSTRTGTVKNVTSLGSMHKSSYKKVTDMSDLPADWIQSQQSMAARYDIDPCEEPPEEHEDLSDYKDSPEEYEDLQELQKMIARKKSK